MSLDTVVEEAVANREGDFFTAPWGEDDHANLRVRLPKGLNMDVAQCRTGKIAKLLAEILNARQ